MQRYKITIEYDGRPFFGWQRQDGHPTVQAALERAASILDGAPVSVHGAGRTDRGVHAVGQVAHFDLQCPRPVHKVAGALNFHLRPDPVAILAAEAVTPHWNARLDATLRVYRYRIINRRADLALRRGQAWRVAAALDAERMNRAAQCLVGRHDFSTFRDTQCQANSPVRTLDRIEIVRSGEQVDMIVAARSFLHRQVRSIIGSLVETGRGARPESWTGTILCARDRTRCGPVAPPDGLYLERVAYGPDASLPD